jgi:hypothetical protein
MTRHEISQQYKLDDNGEFICSPGKFEGEPVYAPYFYDALLNGGADEDDGKTAIFDVNDDDRREFPTLADVARVSLSETNDGFVVVWTELTA